MTKQALLFLPPDVPPDRLAQTMAVLLGAPARRRKVARAPDSIFVEVEGNPGIKQGQVRPAYVEWPIDVGEAALDYVEEHWTHLGEDVWFGAAFSPFHRLDGEPRSMVILGSTPLQVALAVRLAQWFGGEVVPNNKIEDVHSRHERSCPTDEQGLLPESGEAWNRYWLAFLELRPLTEADIREHGTGAAFSYSGSKRNGSS